MQTLLKIWLIPPALNIAVLIAGALLLQRFYKTGMTAILLSVVSLFFLSTPAISSRLAYSLESYPAVQIDKLPGNEKIVIVVAGAAHHVYADEYGTSTPTTTGLARLNYAAYLHNHTGFPILLTGGPLLGHEEPHAEVMARSLKREYQIQADKLEKKSRSTFENAQFSAELLQPDGVRKILLVTHAYHARRSVALFESAGFNVIPAPTMLNRPYDINHWRFWMPDAESLNLSARSIYEYLALARHSLTVDKLHENTSNISLDNRLSH